MRIRVLGGRAILLACGLALASAGPAQGAVTSLQGDTLVVEAAPGEANAISVFGPGVALPPGTAGDASFRVSDGGQPTTAGPGCLDDGSGFVRCPSESVRSLRLTLGDGRDIASVDWSAEAAAASFPSLPAEIDMGPGNDSTLGFGEDVRVTIRGGAGDDVLITGFQDDAISGGSGDDTLSGDRGRDQISGGAGDDELVAFESDVLRGGSGTDFFDTDESPDAVSIFCDQRDILLLTLRRDSVSGCARQRGTCVRRIRIPRRQRLSDSIVVLFRTGARSCTVGAAVQIDFFGWRDFVTRTLRPGTLTRVRIPLPDDVRRDVRRVLGDPRSIETIVAAGQPRELSPRRQAVELHTR